MLRTLSLAFALLGVIAAALGAYWIFGARPNFLRPEWNLFGLLSGLQMLSGGLMALLLGLIGAAVADLQDEAERARQNAERHWQDLRRQVEAAALWGELAPVRARLIADHGEPIGRRAVQLMIEAQVHDRRITEAAALARAKSELASAHR